MTFQADLSFKLDDRAWSERYYLAPLDPYSRDTLADLVEARMQLLAAPAVLLKGRILDLDGPRLPIERWIGRRGHFLAIRHAFLPADNEQEANHPDLSAQVGWHTAAGARRMMFVGGIPLFKVATQPGRRAQQMPVRLVERLLEFKDALQGPRLKLQLSELIPEAEAAHADVERIDTTALGLYRLHLAGDFPAAGNLRVRVLGSRGRNLGALRRERRITAIEGARTVVLDTGPAPGRGPLRYTGGATLVATGRRFSDAIWHPIYDAPTQKARLETVPIISIVIATKPYEVGAFTVASRLRGWQKPARRGRRRASR